MGVGNSSSALDFSPKRFLFRVLTSVHLTGSSGISRAQLKPQVGELAKIFGRNLLKWKDRLFLINKWSWHEFNLTFAIFCRIMSIHFFQKLYLNRMLLVDDKFRTVLKKVSVKIDNVLANKNQGACELPGRPWVGSQATIPTIFQLRKADLKKLLNSL